MEDISAETVPDLGHKFWRLTVIGRVHVDDNRGGRYDWELRCDCGNIVVRRKNMVRRGHTKSCGCWAKERIGNLRRRHGMSHLPVYLNWQTMIQRCENPKTPNFKNYGGRGITVCERWKIFENFYADMGDRPSPAYSIDRRDNDKGYSPDNCRWATAREQMLNTRRSIAKRARSIGVRIMSNAKDTSHDLLLIRRKHGALTPVGHACSNLCEQLLTMKTYVKPEWATHECQTLPGLMKRQMQTLGRAVAL